ncbi:RNA/RNP complex-1-interacting phosphatase homolog [Ptychodera flava]|uniref:RNA/RNP complex-1-interacting phosphatase homolog n=1 Tax=Ptychodera flava TaxID=63121 RepID=UPI00396A1A55
MPKRGIPDRWREYTKCGKLIKNSRIIAFKTPLHKRLCEKSLESAQYFTVDDLLEIPNLGLVISLTFTSRYYDIAEITSKGVLHKRIGVPGQIVPNEGIIREFKTVVQDFIEQNQDTEKVIGVHCTHGVNRTGYVVCRYLIDCLQWSVNKAIRVFNVARGHEIEREAYLEALRNPKRDPSQGKYDTHHTQRVSNRGSGNARVSNGASGEIHGNTGHSGNNYDAYTDITTDDAITYRHSHLYREGAVNDRHSHPSREGAINDRHSDSKRICTSVSVQTKENPQLKSPFEAYIGRLPPDCTVEDVRLLFEDLEIVKEPTIKRRKNYAFGFVRFKDSESLQTALTFDQQQYPTTGEKIRIRVAHQAVHTQRSTGVRQGKKRRRRRSERSGRDETT